MYIRTLLASALMTMLTPIASAIVPIDVQPDPKQGWSGKVGLAFSGKSGNSDEEDFNVSVLTRHRRANRVWLFIGDYNYGETNGERDADDTTLHTRWIERDIMAPNWDLEAFAQWERDDFKDLSDRKLIGAGGRWRTTNDSWHQGDLFTLLGAGLFYEQEEAKTGTEDDTNIRLNLYSKLVWDRNKATYPFKAYGLLYVQPIIDDMGDLRATGTAGLEFNVFEKITLALEVEVEHDTEPFADVDKTDTEYMVKLAYNFD